MRGAGESGEMVYRAQDFAQRAQDGGVQVSK
jgi:hypothetical protein